MKDKGNITIDKKAIYTKNLKKNYGDVKAVDSLDLIVKKGEVYGLVGPNGSGKTTTIKILCGLVRPDSGYGQILGKMMGHKSIPYSIGYMPQETALYPDLTIRENLKMFWGVYNSSNKGYLKREKEVLGLVDLYDRRHFILSKLSGGQRHRVSLSASMIHSPKLLFLDEPTVGVDPPLRAGFWSTFNREKKKGVTILITTHYMDEARHCDRIGLMRDGKLIAQDTPQGIMDLTGTNNLEDAFLYLAEGDNEFDNMTVNNEGDGK